jgi:hypothetical protein
MSENNVDNLKTYLRADYVRQIAAENRDKPIQERWRLIRVQRNTDIASISREPALSGS